MFSENKLREQIRNAYNSGISEVTSKVNKKISSQVLFYRDTLNYTVKFRGIYTVGWKYRRKTPNTVG
jgi:hypothetical protein